MTNDHHIKTIYLLDKYGTKTREKQAWHISLHISKVYVSSQLWGLCLHSRQTKQTLAWWACKYYIYPQIPWKDGENIARKTLRDLSCVYDKKYAQCLYKHIWYVVRRLAWEKAVSQYLSHLLSRNDIKAIHTD